jgi:hypothetical protein
MFDYFCKTEKNTASDIARHLDAILSWYSSFVMGLWRQRQNWNFLVKNISYLNYCNLYQYILLTCLNLFVSFLFNKAASIQIASVTQIIDMEQLEDRISRDTEVLGKNLHHYHCCLPQIPHDLMWDWTWVTTVVCQ